VIRNNFTDQPVEVGRGKVVEISQRLTVMLRDARQQLLGCLVREAWF